MIGVETLGSFAAIGRIALFTASTLRHLVTQPFYGREFGQALFQMGVSETLCMRLSPCGFDGLFIEPFWV